MRGRFPNLAMGFVLSLVLFLGVALLSGRPVWQSLPDDHGLLRLSFTTSGARRCRDRTPEELASLPRNMRQEQVCERRRAPVQVEMDLNGQALLSETLQPTGLAGSGPSRIYRRFELSAGEYDVALRLRTDPDAAEFASTTQHRVELRPGQSLAIDYDDETSSFVFGVPRESE